MVHGPIKEIWPREGILNFVKQQEAVGSLRQDSLAEEVTSQPLPIWQSFPVVVFGAHLKQAGFDMLRQGSGQLRLAGAGWVIRQDVGPGFPPFQGLAHVPDQKAEVRVVGKITQ